MRLEKIGQYLSNNLMKMNVRKIYLNIKKMLSVFFSTTAAKQEGNFSIAHLRVSMKKVWMTVLKFLNVRLLMKYFTDQNK